MSSRDWVMGWDIGGAHVKAALVCDGKAQWAMQWPCPLWQGMHHLERVIAQAREAAFAVSQQASMRHAVTMTGELVDLFSSRAEGVNAIVKCLQQGLNDKLNFFAGSHGFMSANDATGNVNAIASANWLATAQALAKLCDAQEYLTLIDIGSTTTDIIALSRKGVHAQGTDDFSRLSNDELLYTGCVRTPLMALAQRIPFEGHEVNVMAEYFATMADVYRLTGELNEDWDQHAAADNGEKTPAASARRLARMIGRDATSAPLRSWQSLAEQFARIQRSQIAHSLERVLLRLRPAQNPQLVLTGSGAFIGEKLAHELGYEHERLSARMHWQGIVRADTCAPAVAVALLLADQV